MSYAPSQENRGSSTWIIVVAILAALFLGFLICAGVLAGLMIPTVQAARTAARRMQSSNNMKQIELALHNYESAYKKLPPAYTVDQDGNRLHSWRTLILPYLEQSALYQQIDLNRSWDHPDNAVFNNMSIPVYESPIAQLPSGMTPYLAIVDDRAMFTGPDGVKFESVSDGISNTVMTFETNQEHAVHWMEPTDSDIQSFIDAVQASGMRNIRGTNLGLGDGSVRFQSGSTPRESLESMATRNGGEAFVFD
jgi:type II secretory pathway pseudopilin PulG